MDSAHGLRKHVLSRGDSHGHGGGSSVIAALAMMKRAAGWQLSAILSGVIMLLWIVAEIASIRGFHFLQVIYFVTGAAVIWLTPKAESVPR